MAGRNTPPGFYLAEMRYNYILFNGYDGFNMSSYNEEGYYSICMRDLWAYDNILISNCPFDYANFPIKLCYKFSNKYHFPFNKLWFPFFYKSSFRDEKPLCFIIVGFEWPMAYLKWLKAKYPNAKFVRFTRDLISTQQSFIDKLKASGVVDYWITYDENEAKKYDMLYYPEVESKIDLGNNFKIKYDVFFAGRAKKRLSRIVEIYDVLETAGLNCFFYIMSANPDEIAPRKGIVYSDKYLTYRQMLEYDLQSRCLLEVNQEGAVGYTARFIEAVLYNKLLLTDNNSIISTSFYNPNFMQCFSNPSEINTDFIKNDQAVDYKYKSEFSPVHLIEYLEELLK